VLWPWALLVPLGFASVDILLLLARRAATAVPAFGGMPLYC
jgi:hypothetical protein